ncbi:unnamed protein product [Linum tenue]|uniref:DYW domain-containing protein n=1 Tax=Linum tenue TaxID=586396 RepID=A0AAV0Q066_9ROSI|nr:unnamed protein product [Linum tenue]
MEWFRLSEKPSISSSTYCAVLQLCGELKSLQDGKEVHSVISCNDVQINGILGTRLVFMYVSCGELSQGRLVFDQVVNEKVFLWNLMINEYAKVEDFAECVYLFQKMLNAGIAADSYTFSCILKCFAASGSVKNGEWLHGYLLKLDLAACSCSVVNSLLSFYAKVGRVESARKLFDELPQRDVVSWNSMISGYVANGGSEEGLEVFKLMVSSGVEIDLASASRVFEKTSERSVVSWTSMIQAYSRSGLLHDAIRLFHEMTMVSGKWEPDGRTISCILPACASLSALNMGRQIHCHVLRNGHHLSDDRHITNALVDMYIKCGALVLARSLFDTMIPSKDLVSWTVMIAGYGMHGFGKEAIRAFEEMRRDGIKPDGVSFISVLYACSHSGLVNEGWRFFNIMQKECKIEPSLEHYACMVDLLSRSGKLQMAYEFIKGMPIKPDATIWGALLCGCRIHHDVKLAERVAEHVFELEPENARYYVLLANIYAEAEKWEEVKELRVKIGRRGLKKHPGCSWIEVKGKVHVFVAKDGSHPEVRKIEALLRKVREGMKKEGFSPKLRYALMNGDDLEKEMALCGHSEKLAMGFGILNLPPGKTVRVMKNLRVCRDCHEMAKFMSKTTGREIILRDSNFFHHFKDGSCSCRGFW